MTGQGRSQSRNQGLEDDLYRCGVVRRRASAEGVPIRGYFLWSLMDNFEWTFGFQKRFDLYRVDFDTEFRTQKLSASFYRDVIARNAIGT